MRYFPILQELFESDTVIFLVIGIAVSVFAGLRLKNHRKYIIGTILNAAVYAICELLSNIHTNFMLELILLFVGTIAIGWCVGFIICALFRLLKTFNYRSTQ